MRDAVRDALASWSRFVAEELRAAVAAGELPADTDLDQLAFELGGVVLAAQQAIRLHGDPTAPDRARRAIDRLLGG